MQLFTQKYITSRQRGCICTPLTSPESATAVCQLIMVCELITSHTVSSQKYTTLRRGICSNIQFVSWMPPSLVRGQQSGHSERTATSCCTMEISNAFVDTSREASKQLALSVVTKDNLAFSQCKQQKWWPSNKDIVNKDKANKDIVILFCECVYKHHQR